MNFTHWTMPKKYKPKPKPKPKPDYPSIVLSIIKSYRGEENMRTQELITDEVNAMGYRISTRTTRKILRELIDEGYPILSTPRGGYYWYDTEEERKECYSRLRHKGISILLRARNINRNCLAEKARRQEREQLEMFGLARVS